MSAGEMLLVVVASAFGGAVQGSTGIGLTLVAGPALFSVDSAFAPGPLLAAGMIVSIRHLGAEWRRIDGPGLAKLALGAPVGVVVGLFVLTAVSERTMGLLVGSIVLVAALVVLSGVHPVRSDLSLVAGGTVTALSSVTAGLPGPPLAIVLHDAPGPVVRSTVAAFLLPLSAAGVILMTIFDEFGSHELGLTLRLVPGVVGGLVAARWLRPLVDRSWFRPLILLIAAAGGAALLLRNL